MRQIHLIPIISLLFFVGCTRQPESKRVLVTTFVEKKTTFSEEVLSLTNISEIAFIAFSQKPISISLPLGEGYACSSAFQLHVNDACIQVSDVFLSCGGRKDRSLFPENEHSAYGGPYQACSGSMAQGLAGNPIKLAQWGYGLNDEFLSFKVFIIVEPLKSEPIPKPDSAYEYQGRLYHVLQNADPKNMRYGNK